MPKSIFSIKSNDVKTYKNNLATAGAVTVSETGDLYIPIELISRSLGMRRDVVVRSAKRHLKKEKLHHVLIGSMKTMGGNTICHLPDIENEKEAVISIHDADEFLDAIKKNTKLGDAVERLRDLIRGFRPRASNDTPSGFILPPQKQLPRSDITYLRQLLSEAIRVAGALENGSSAPLDLDDTITAKDALNERDIVKAATDATLASHTMANNLMEAGAVPFINASMEEGKVFVSADLRHLGWVTITDLWKDYCSGLKRDETPMKQNEFTGLVYWTFCEKLRNSSRDPVVRSNMLRNKMASVLRIRLPALAAHDRTTAMLARYPKRAGAAAIMAANWSNQLWFTAEGREYMVKNLQRLIADWTSVGFIKHAEFRSPVPVSSEGLADTV